MNIVILQGKLGRDPELKALQSGTGVCNMSLATDEWLKTKASDKSEKQTEWHTIVSFGKLAEICGQMGFKGARVFVQGRLKTDKWEKDGVTHYRTKIIASNVQFLDPARKDNVSDGERGGSPDDDVPF